MTRLMKPVDFEAFIFSLLVAEYSTYGDRNGFPVTLDSYFVSDLEINGDCFYEFVEDLERDLEIRFSDDIFAKIVGLVPSEGELLSLFWWKVSRRDITVRDLAIQIKFSLKEERDARLIS